MNLNVHFMYYLDVCIIRFFTITSNGKDIYIYKCYIECDAPTYVKYVVFQSPTYIQLLSF